MKCTALPCVMVKLRGIAAEILTSTQPIRLHFTPPLTEQIETKGRGGISHAKGVFHARPQGAHFTAQSKSGAAKEFRRARLFCKLINKITFASETALSRSKPQFAAVSSLSTVNCRDYTICGLFKVAARARGAQNHGKSQSSPDKTFVSYQLSDTLNAYVSLSSGKMGPLITGRFRG